jgi:glycosyltransferase involved in cell wall biosynthesis
LKGGAVRVVFISTYPPIECGIGTYTSFLVEALERTPNEVYIVSPYGAEGRHVYPCFDPGDDGIAKKIFHFTNKVTPEVVHIQHEFGLYGELDGIAVLEVIYRFKSIGIPVMATLHTVKREPGFRKKMILETMCRELDGIIVHEEYMVDLLRTVYHTEPKKIFLVPHGARVKNPVTDAKNKLNLNGRKVILMAGYIKPTKCFDKIVDLFPAILDKVPEALLAIASKQRIPEINEYQRSLLERISNSPARNRIEVFRGQFPQKTFDTILSASDIMVLPYSDGAQSGIMAHALTFGKPVVSSDLPAFASKLEESGAGLYARTDQEYVDQITALLSDQELYNKLSMNALSHVKKKISWDIVAQQTEEIYKKLERKPEYKTRYVFVGE